ncbi:hypothetical protein EmuJ_000220000 [Echinococcus multilocularis]|uniref:Uncharacterized protein n=1 Tax=Echinococcus multilocularis TaxID=6211 RepID=A0A087W1L4_ECHMU|nr:hypothetical protein EmuJ_000220000 [Echinococcus multilocularis]
MARMHDDVDKENDPSSSSLMGKSLPNLESGTKAESNFPLHCLANLLPSTLHPPRDDDDDDDDNDDDDDGDEVEVEVEVEEEESYVPLLRH